MDARTRGKVPPVKERRAAGLCNTCGRRPLQTAWECRFCAEKNRRRARERKRRYRAAGICVRCERAPAATAGFCAPCWAVQRETVRQSERRRVQAGICERCTKKRVTARSCLEHHLKKKAQRLKSRLRKRQAGGEARA